MSLINFPSPADWPGISNGALSFLGQVFRACFASYESGTTANRPISGLWVGRRYFDTTIGKPVWIKTVGPVVWVDATGAPV